MSTKVLKSIGLLAFMLFASSGCMIPVSPPSYTSYLVGDNNDSGSGYFSQILIPNILITPNFSHSRSYRDGHHHHNRNYRGRYDFRYNDSGYRRSRRNNRRW